MMNRYDIKKIIKDNPEDAHHIIADNLNGEAFWILLITLATTVSVLVVLLAALIYQYGQVH